MEKVGTEHLLLALLKDTECVATRLLHTMEIDIRKLYLSVLSAMGIEESMYKELAQKEKARRDGGATPVLNQYSRDLTEMAAEGELDPIVGRDAEIERILQILSRRTKNNPCLIGEPGVGKTAIAEEAARVDRASIAHTDASEQTRGHTGYGEHGCWFQIPRRV